MPQDTQRTNELLEALLSRELTNDEIVDQIAGLIRDRIDEDIHLDYKRGDVLERGARTPPPQLLREYVGGFANSAGGMLMVGVDAPEAAGAQWRVTGCRAPGGGSLANWASNSLTPIAGYLSPPPVLYEVPHPDGPVLIAVVARAPRLVPCSDRGNRRLLYHLRLDHQTLAADEYLVADLVLGRRQHAYLGITGVGMFGGSNPDPGGNSEWRFRMRFSIENEGLARAENVRLGIVSMGGRYVSSPGSVSDHLRRHVTVVGPDPDKYKGEVNLGQHVAGCPALEPFASEILSTVGCISVPVRWVGGFYIYEWKAAMYVTAESTPPAWYQLSVEVDSPLLEHLKSDKTVSTEGPFLRIERVIGRPIVGWVGENI